MIGGLLSNGGNNSVDKAPFLGDLPIIGALFRSNSFRRNQTELVIVVTPFLVHPVSASQIALPTDGFHSANDAQRLLLGKSNAGKSGETRPMPTMAPPQTIAPAITTGAATTAQPGSASASAAAPKPGFGF
jgi:pilus assembly protein CpaC